mmetsp:Transcript_152622/g.489416  ORF Transcript_152622/g.489416 Transcript_152622/m.489416 type:complete len:613 (-) Transcript_152622:486-2324(-)
MCLDVPLDEGVADVHAEGELVGDAEQGAGGNRSYFLGLPCWQHYPERPTATWYSCSVNLRGIGRQPPPGPTTLADQCQPHCEQGLVERRHEHNLPLHPLGNSRGILLQPPALLHTVQHSSSEHQHRAQKPGGAPARWWRGDVGQAQEPQEEQHDCDAPSVVRNPPILSAGQQRMHRRGHNGDKSRGAEHRGQREEARGDGENLNLELEIPEVAARVAVAREPKRVALPRQKGPNVTQQEGVTPLLAHALPGLLEPPHAKPRIVVVVHVIRHARKDHQVDPCPEGTQGYLPQVLQQRAPEATEQPRGQKRQRAATAEPRRGRQNGVGATGGGAALEPVSTCRLSGGFPRPAADVVAAAECLRGRWALRGSLSSLCLPPFLLGWLLARARRRRRRCRRCRWRWRERRCSCKDNRGRWLDGGLCTKVAPRTQVCRKQNERIVDERHRPHGIKHRISALQEVDKAPLGALCDVQGEQRTSQPDAQPAEVRALQGARRAQGTPAAAERESIQQPREVIGESSKRGLLRRRHFRLAGEQPPAPSNGEEHLRKGAAQQRQPDKKSESGGDHVPSVVLPSHRCLPVLLQGETVLDTVFLVERAVWTIVRMLFEEVMVHCR